MNREILNAFILSLLFLSLFGIAEILYHFFKVKSEITRKLVHFGTGLLTLLFPLMLHQHVTVFILCSGFALILLLSIRYNTLKSIHAIDRYSVGSIAYPAAVYLCFLTYSLGKKSPSFFYIPILILAVSDPLAALFGRKWPMFRYRIGSDTKTLTGSAAFVLSAALLILLLPLISDAFNTHPVSVSQLLFTVPVIAALAEALSPRGYDNLTIPASVLACMTILENYTEWN